VIGQGADAGFKSWLPDRGAKIRRVLRHDQTGGWSHRLAFEKHQKKYLGQNRPKTDLVKFQHRLQASDLQIEKAFTVKDIFNLLILLTGANFLYDEQADHEPVKK
jgi:hypothetical protein